MPRDFQYQRRSEESWERRNSGNYEGYILDQFALFRAKKGENRIRIYPPTWKGADHYGLDVWIHYGVGPDRASVICLQKMRNEPCPVCEERARIQRRGDEDEAKQLRPNKRVVCWVENKKDDKGGVQIWGMPGTLDTDISKRAKDRESGAIQDIDHPDTGYDVYFDVEGERDRTRYNAVELSKNSNSVSQKNLDFVIDNPIPNTLRWRTYEEALALFEGGAVRPSGGGKSRDSGPDDRSGDSRGRDRDERPAERDADADRPREREEPKRSAARDEDERPRETTRDRDERPREEERPRDPEPERGRPSLRERGNGDDREAKPRSNGEDRGERDRDERPGAVRGSDRAAELSQRFARDRRE